MPMNSGPSSVQNPAFLKWLIVMGLIEGTSTLVLFGIAMPLKYLGDMPQAVHGVGLMHGVLFSVLGLFVLHAWLQVREDWPRHAASSRPRFARLAQVKGVRTCKPT